MESVADDARKVHILDEGDLINGLVRIGLGLGRSESQVGEYTREVRSELNLDELRVDFWIKLLHVKQAYNGRLHWLLLLLRHGHIGGLARVPVVSSYLRRSLQRFLLATDLSALKCGRLHCVIISLIGHSGPNRTISSSVSRACLFGRVAIGRGIVGGTTR